MGSSFQPATFKLEITSSQRLDFNYKSNSIAPIPFGTIFLGKTKQKYAPMQGARRRLGGNVRNFPPQRGS